MQSYDGKYAHELYGVVRTDFYYVPRIFQSSRQSREAFTAGHEALRIANMLRTTHFPTRVLRRGLHLYRRTLEGPAEALTNSRPPLILIHGLFGNSTNFRSPGLKLAQGRDVLLVDLRNHGQSPWSDDTALEAMASDIIELLDDEGIEQAALCGHSLGGKVAMVAALTAPERVSRLVIADIAPVEYTETHAGWRANHMIMDAMAALPEDALASRPTADAALAEAGIGEPGIRGFLLQNLLPDERRFRFNLHTLRAAAQNGAPFAGFPGHLPSAPSTLPVCVIAGSKSTYANRPEHRAAIERLFPGAEPSTHVLNAGHWLHAERPDEFVALVDAFCKEGEQ